MIRTILHGKFQHDCIPGTKQVWMELGQSCLKLLQGPLWPLHVHLWMLEAQLEATCKVHSIAVSWETESQHWGQQDGKLTYKQLLVKHSKEIPRIKNNKSRIKINKHGFMKLDSPKFLLYTDYKWSPDLIAWWFYAIVRLGTDGAGTQRTFSQTSSDGRHQCRALGLRALQSLLTVVSFQLWRLGCVKHLLGECFCLLPKCYIFMRMKKLLFHLINKHTHTCTHISMKYLGGKKLSRGKDAESLLLFEKNPCCNYRQLKNCGERRKISQRHAVEEENWRLWWWEACTQGCWTCT